MSVSLWHKRAGVSNKLLGPDLELVVEQSSALARSYETSARPHLSGGKIIISANVSLIAVIISK